MLPMRITVQLSYCCSPFLRKLPQSTDLVVELSSRTPHVSTIALCWGLRPLKLGSVEMILVISCVLWHCSITTILWYNLSELLFDPTTTLHTLGCVFVDWLSSSKGWWPESTRRLRESPINSANISTYILLTKLAHHISPRSFAQRCSIDTIEICALWRHPQTPQ